MRRNMYSLDKAQYLLKEKITQYVGEPKVPHPTQLTVSQLLLHVAQQRCTLVIYGRSHTLNCIEHQRPKILM